MELFKAHQQWATRPPDERFDSLDALYAATHQYATSARELTIPWSDLRTEAQDGDVVLLGKVGRAPARLTHWSFGQLSARVGAPSDYLRGLPATLACQNLNHGLANRVQSLTRAIGSPAATAALTASREASLLFHTNGELLCRALTSDRYSRIWNHEVTSRLLRLQEDGWAPARPTIRRTTHDQLPLYASDHDMFAFVARADLAIAEPGSDQPLYRGVIVENSEVGAASLKLTRFLYRAMCGNHIIWGAEDVSDLSLRHVGNVRGRMALWSAELRRYANQSASDDVARIEAAQRTRIAATKEEVLDRLFGIRKLALSRKTLEAGMTAHVPAADGDPLTPWGVAQGLTRYSQTLPFADKRTDVDRAAGRLLAMAF